MSKFIIHFDLDGNEHKIPIEQSIATEKVIMDIVRQINKNFFNSQIDVQLYVESSENGGFIQKFSIVPVITFVAGVAGMVGPDFLNGYSLRWTGKEVKEHVRDGTTGELFSKVTEKFLGGNNQELQECGFSIKEFYPAYKAKNVFFEQAINNSYVKAVGFDCSYDFALKREDFSGQILSNEEFKRGLKPIEKYHHLKVISQINNRDYKNLTWDFSDIKKKEKFSAYMGDNDFYERLFNEHLNIQEIIARVRYILEFDDKGDLIIGEKRVMSVYSYNQKVLFSLPDNISIEDAPLKVLDIDENKIEYFTKEDDVKDMQMFLPV